MRVLFAICILSFTTSAQNLQDHKKIDDNYNTYLKTIFEPSITKKTRTESKISKNIVFGKLNQNKSLLQLTKQYSFSISNTNKEDKLMAAILHGTKHDATYEFVADDYEQYNTSKEIIMREFLKIKIHAVPDTSTMKIKEQIKINSLETITQFEHNKLMYLKNPITILFYSNHHENANGIQKSSKTIIKHCNKILYSSVQNGNKNSLKHDSKMNKYLFLYELETQNKIITGGLMNHLLMNFLRKIKDDIHLNAIHISKVYDLYRRNIKDLKRICNMGVLNQTTNTIEYVFNL